MTATGITYLLNTLRITTTLATTLATLLASSAINAIPSSSLTDESPHIPTSFDTFTRIGRTADPQLLKALDQLNTGDTESAIVQTQAYLVEHPRSAEAFELLGAALAMSGKIEQALPELRKAIRINPKQSTAYTKIGDIYMTQGQFDKARYEFEQARQINPGDRLNYQRLGYLAERANNTKAAIANYERGVRGMPARSVGIKLRLASLYNKTGAFAKAAALLEPVVNMDNKDPAAHLVLGTSYLGLDRTDQAITRFKRARVLKGNEARVALALGIAYRKQDDLAASLNELDKVIAAAPDWSTGYYQKGETANAMQQHKMALKAYQSAEKLSANPALIRHKIADTLSILQRHEEATAIYLSLLENTKQNSPAYLTLLNALATTYREQNKLDQAESTYKHMIEVYPKSGYGYHQLGSFYGYQQRYNKAIEAYRKGLRHVPDDNALIKSLIVAYSRLGKHQQAADMAFRLVELNPDNINAALFAATLQEDAGNITEADKGYSMILNNNPDNILALNNLAMLRSNKNDHATALELANRASKLAPDDANILDTYGWVLYRKGDYAKATQIQKQAVELAPQNPSIYYHLGLTSQALKDVDTAKQSFEKALSLSKDFTEAADTRKRLDDLKNL